MRAGLYRNAGATALAVVMLVNVAVGAVTGFAAISVGAWFGLYGLMLLVTRPRSVRALPCSR